MQSRFFYDEPRPASVADRLLDNAEKLQLTLYRDEDGNATVAIEVRSTLGADLFPDEDGDSDLAEQSRKSAEAMDFAGQLLRSFAAAGKDGAQ